MMRTRKIRNIVAQAGSARRALCIAKWTVARCLIGSEYSIDFE
jgi:hypothetical protein